jgi:hypothetical protein
VEPQVPGQNVFRRVGPEWLIAYRGEERHLPDLKGFHYIARLLGEPGERIHVLDLVAPFRRTGALGEVARENAPTQCTERLRKAVTNRIRGAICRIAESQPDLALHLTKAIRTGALCSYAPGVTTGWNL